MTLIPATNLAAPLQALTRQGSLRQLDLIVKKSHCERESILLIVCKNRQLDNTRQGSSNVLIYIFHFQKVPFRSHEFARAPWNMNERQQPRFPICELALVTFSPNDSSEIATITENISTTGVLLRSTSSLAQGSRVQVRIPMPSGAAELKGSGSVIRTSQREPSGYFLIAVACDQPFDLSSRQR